jgi:GH15 family glucan-1,4-alpha-glucosidase
MEDDGAHGTTMLTHRGRLALLHATSIGSPGYQEDSPWAAARDEIREAILTRGWSEKRQAYAQSFESDELDGAQLLMPIYGFLPATDRACARRSRRSRAT